MRCENALDFLLDERDDPASKRVAEEHLVTCASCRDACYAAERLRALRAEPIPDPRAGALERALDAATSAAATSAPATSATGLPHLRRLQSVPARIPLAEPASSAATRGASGAAPATPVEPSDRALARASGSRASDSRRAGFWLGMGIGGSLAAALALAWFTFFAPQPYPPGAATPEVTLALNETRDVSIAVNAPAALANAEIHVVLTGAIGLAGFDGQRELRWRTDLDAGSNQLTLPVVAFGSRGQLLVEVQHGAKRRTFVVDVRGTEA